MCLVGEELFSNALKIYFKKFEFNNATFADFILTIDGEFKKANPNFDLVEWSKQWLSKAGLNECICDFNPNNSSKKVMLSIFQNSCLEEFPTLRKHQMKIGFIDQFGNITSKSILLLDQPITQIEYDGSQNYKAVLLNHEDQTFIKVVLDYNSAEFLQHNLYYIKETLARTMIYRCFYDMVRDGKMSSSKFILTCKENILKESDQGIISDILQFANLCIVNYSPLSYQQKLSHCMFQLVFKMLSNENNCCTINAYQDQNTQTTLKNYLIMYAKIEEDIDVLYNWFYKKEPKLEEFSLSIYQRWQIVLSIHKSSKYERIKKQKMFNDMIGYDPSDSKISYGKTCQAFDATSKERFELWKSYMDPNNHDSVQLTQASMKGFNNSNVKIDSMVKYHDLYFANLIDIFRKRQREFALAFAETLFPVSDDCAKYIEIIEILLIKSKEDDISLVRFLKEKKDELNRKIKSLECFQNEIIIVDQIII